MPRMKSNIPHPRGALFLRHVQLAVKQQVEMLALTLDRTQEEVANTALKIGLKVLMNKVASGDLKGGKA